MADTTIVHRAGGGGGGVGDAIIAEDADRPTVRLPTRRNVTGVRGVSVAAPGATGFGFTRLFGAAVVPVAAPAFSVGDSSAAAAPSPVAAEPADLRLFDAETGGRGDDTTPPPSGDRPLLLTL